MVLTNLEAASLLLGMLLVLTFFSRWVLGPSSLPTTIHNVVWAVSLCAFATGLIKYKTFPPHAWALLAGGLIAFNVGAVGVGLILKQLDKKKGRQVRPVSGLSYLMSRRTFVVLLSLFILGFGGYLASIHSRFGITTLLTHPSIIRSAKDPSYLETVPLWARLLMYLGPLLLAFVLVPRAIKGKIPWYVRTAVILFVGLALLLLLQRTNLLMGLGFVCAAFLLLRKPADATAVELSQGTETAREGSGKKRGIRSRENSSLRTGLIIVAILVVSFAAFIVVGISLGKTGSASASYSPLLRSAGLQNPFLYLTSGIPAFLALTDFTSTAWPPSGTGLPWVFGNFNPQTWGAATFEPLVSQLPVIRPWNPIAPFTNVGVDTNIFTWYEPFYRDFRQLGVLLGSAILGAVLTLLFSQRWTSPALFWIATVMVSTMFFAPEVPKYNSTGYLFAIVVILMVAGAERFFNKITRNSSNSKNRQ